MKRIQIYNSSFENLIKNDYLYVDKTSYLYHLIGNKHCFLSRPKGFGKSLTLSTLYSIFKGEKELFKETFIYNKYEFEGYPIVHISMSDVKGRDPQSIINDIKDILFSYSKIKMSLAKQA